MSSLFEVVFENVAKSNVTELVMALVASEKQIVSAQCSEDIEIMDGGKLNTNTLDSALNFEGSLTVLINLRELKVGDIVLPKVLLRIVKYADQYDIDFSFDESMLEKQSFISLITELQGYANKLATDYNIRSVFGGIEPASDEETRYFSNEALGPLARQVK